MRQSHIVTRFGLFCTMLAAAATPALALGTQDEEAAEGESQAVAERMADTPPSLVVAISVDQFSADLFAQYRNHFTGGLKRLLQGAVFPSGFQAHAATETCPGHSGIMTGAYPARTGIIANDWIDLSTGREDKMVYCAEDERIEGSDSRNYVESSLHLLVPTLGDRAKQARPAVRNVAVAGKDRAAIMMGGHDLDAIYFWKGKGFATLRGGEIAPEVAAYNERLAVEVDAARAPSEIPAWCAPTSRAIPYGDAGRSVGTYAFERPQGGGMAFRASPDFDTAVLRVADTLVETMDLGGRPGTDILSVGLSATDYVGHSFGTNGLEMCIQMAALDSSLGAFFESLDARGIDYVVVLTADHGGHDLPERLVQQGVPDAHRVDRALGGEAVGKAVAAALGMDPARPLLHSGGPFGDYYLDLALSDAERATVKAKAMEIIAANSDVAEVIDGEALAAMDLPRGPVQQWTLAERARASYHPDRSGDFIVLLKQHVTPIADPTYYVATHGSPWDYDRRVPILFWRKGITAFEQPVAVGVVDIAPTLATLIDLPVEDGAYDGRCLDIDGGEGNICG